MSKSNESDENKKWTLVLNPEWTPMIIWELIVNIVYVISFFLVPYILIDPDELLPNVRWLELCIDFFIFGDMIMDFFTAYYSDSELITEHKLIIINYLSTYFFFDLISWTPGLFTGEGVSGVYFMKIFRYVQFKRFVEFTLNLLNQVRLWFILFI